jgi:Leucine-rich repeat (LRR) protein
LGKVQTGIEIYNSIESAKKTGHLDLSNLELLEIPEAIFALSQLVSLELSENLISEIPKEIGKLAQLEKINLYGSNCSSWSLVAA